MNRIDEQGIQYRWTHDRMSDQGILPYLGSYAPRNTPQTLASGLAMVLRIPMRQRRSCRSCHQALEALEAFGVEGGSC